MKKLTVMLLASIFFFSCEGDFDKKSKEVAGVWTIQKVSYSDGTKVQTKEGIWGKSFLERPILATRSTLGNRECK